MNFMMFKLVLEKAEEPEIKLPTSAGSWKKAREFQKNTYFCFIVYAKAFVKITINCGIFFKRWEATIRTGHGTTDWFQIGKGVHQGCILSPCLSNLYAEYRSRQWHPTPVLLPGKIPWMEEPGRLQSLGSLRVGHD